MRKIILTTSIFLSITAQAQNNISCSPGNSHSNKPQQNQPHPSQNYLAPRQQNHTQHAPQQYRTPQRSSQNQPYYNNARPNYPRPPRGYRPPTQKKKSRFGFNSFNFNNPKKSMSNMWDDSWKEPTQWGRMPGGWNFPDISMPNPVDSADDFSKSIKDIPDGFNQN